MKLAGLKLDLATLPTPEVEEGKPEARPYTPIGEIIRSITKEADLRAQHAASGPPLPLLADMSRALEASLSACARQLSTSAPPSLEGVLRSLAADLELQADTGVRTSEPPSKVDDALAPLIQYIEQALDLAVNRYARELAVPEPLDGALASSMPRRPSTCRFARLATHTFAPHAETVLRRVGADLDSQAAANESKAAVRVQAHVRGSAARNQLQEKRRREWLSYSMEVGNFDKALELAVTCVQLPMPTRMPPHLRADRVPCRARRREEESRIRSMKQSAAAAAASAGAGRRR